MRRKNEGQDDEMEDLRDEEEDVTKPEEQVGARCLNIRVHFRETHSLTGYEQDLQDFQANEED